MTKEALFENVKARLEDMDRQKCEEITHSVLSHLWRRLPPDERKHMINSVQPEIAGMLRESTAPESAEASVPNITKGSIDYDTLDTFTGEVRRETQLKADGRDLEAIQAVFGALKTELPNQEIMHIQETLPEGLQKMWASA